MVKNILPIIIVLLFSIIAGFPLLHKGLPPTHDGEYHVVRFYEFDKVIRDGDWYPRFAPDFNYGFGIPLFNYVYPFPNYVAYFTHLFGISFIDSFKLNMFFATIGGGIFFYLWSNKFWGKIGGIVSSVFYTFSPYHFVDIYIRGSVGEVWALAFFPAFLWSITEFFNKKNQKYFIASSIFLALIILSHNILALMFFPFALAYITLLIYQSKEKRYFISNTLYVILLGLGLSSIFWLPALFESHYVRGLQIFDFSRHFPDFYQLIIPSWGSGFSGQNSSNQLSFQIGAANLLGLIMSLVALIINFKKKNNSKSIIVFSFIWFVIIFFLMLKASLSIWERTPLMSYFQFPWRFLSLEILISSFLAGSVFAFYKSKILLFAMLGVVVAMSIGYAKPAYYHDRNDAYYISRSNFMDGTNSTGNSFNTIWINRELKRQENKLIFLDGNGIVLKQEIKSTKYIFKIFSKENSQIAVNTVYFPGWRVSIDKNNLKKIKNLDGIISFNIAKGDHLIQVMFKDTSIRTTSQLIFWLSLISIFILLIKGYFVKIK